MMMMMMMTRATMMKMMMIMMTMTMTIITFQSVRHGNSKLLFKFLHAQIFFLKQQSYASTKGCFVHTHSYALSISSAIKCKEEIWKEALIEEKFEKTEKCFQIKPCGKFSARDNTSRTFGWLQLRMSVCDVFYDIKTSSWTAEEQLPHWSARHHVISLECHHGDPDKTLTQKKVMKPKSQ